MSDNNKTFVFSDIHGCADELKLLLSRIPLDTAEKLVFLGDYVDRGKDSKEVIQTILNLKNKYNVVTLKGNHEQLFLNFIENPNSPESGTFIFNGGGATLASYGNDRGEYDIPKKHYEFLNGLKLYHEDENFLFVHAGLPDVPLNEINPDDHEEIMLWIREPFYQSKYNWGKTIIHGHTPVEEVHITDTRINIDTGCVYSGTLTCLQLPERIFYSVPLQGETQLYTLTDKESTRRAVRHQGSIPVLIESDNGFIAFETINFSDYGMLIREMDKTKKDRYQIGLKLKGRIGKQNKLDVQFEGEVVNILKINGEIDYAVNFTKTPYDFWIKNK